MLYFKLIATIIFFIYILMFLIKIVTTNLYTNKVMKKRINLVKFNWLLNAFKLK